jgi:hypothetical protein
MNAFTIDQFVEDLDAIDAFFGRGDLLAMPRSVSFALAGSQLGLFA